MKLPLALLAAFAFCTHLSLGAETKAPAPPPGLRIATAGHSFHIWMPRVLGEIAAAAGIRGHETVVRHGIGGSQTIQHWEVPDGENKIKPVLIAGTIDVLTLAPARLPDPGVEKFLELGLKHNPALRVTVQQMWVGYDDPSLWPTRARGVVIDRDKKTIAELRAAHAARFTGIAALVRELRQRHGPGTIFLVPDGEAVLALREKVIAGEVPGVTAQSQLFRDRIGHPLGHIRTLSTYCHYAVIYRRSPEGLPVPRELRELPHADKLNALLQKLAWQAIVAEPLSGVSANAAAEQ